MARRARGGRPFHEVLGIARTASEGDIKIAFKKLAKVYHPDVNSASDAAERFQGIVDLTKRASSTLERQPDQVARSSEVGHRHHHQLGARASWVSST